MSIKKILKELLKDNPICTDKMPMLNSGFNGEREVKL